MNAVSVYVNTAKLVLQSTEATSAAGSLNPELGRLLLNLRQLLACVVCNRLVNDPYTPHNAQCAHNVCRLCVRGQKNLHPVCSYCKDNKDYKTYGENKQLRCLLMCYKSLCEHLRCSSMFALFAGLKVGQYSSIAVPTISVPQMSLQELVTEGANYDDVLNAFTSDLPKSFILPMAKPQQIPALVTPLTSIAAATPLVPIKVASMQVSAPKASTPPAAVSAPISTYGSKLKVENSFQHHYKHQTSMTTPVVSLSNACSIQEHQTPLNASVTHPQLIQLNQLKNSGNITYIGTNTRGIVVPIVSSSGSTAVPLSIASARLQTLNRQLAQARALAVSSAAAASTSTVNTTTNPTNIEHRSPLGTLKVSAASSQTIKCMPTFSSTTTTASGVTTTSQTRNPPPIKTVSNGSAMYSVLYTGIGNKITIKRKTDGDEDSTQKKNTPITTTSSNILRPLSKTPNKKRGCRCGNTTATPGKLTCCGQRCPCYVDSKSCIGCKCRGCRNPHRPDGNKVRPIIPELACYEIQMADDLGNVNELPIATASNVLNTMNNDNNAPTSHLNTSLNLNATTSSSAGAAIVSTSSNTTLVPLRGLHHFSSPSVSSSSSSCITSTIPPLTSTTMPTQTSSMTQASFGSTSASSIPVSVATSMSSNITAPGNIVQLDQIQRESLLIQNAEGKFQVVNVFTTGSNVGGNSNGAVQSSNQIPTLQRFKTMPQTVVSAHNSFVLPSSISTTSMSGTTTTTSLPQLILQSQQQQQHQQHQPAQHFIQNQQHQQQQHQQHLNHQLITPQRMSNNITATSLPRQLQQQLKQNIITVHAIHTNPTTNTSPVTAPVLTPSSSPAPTSATISLPPLISSNSHAGLELSDSTEITRNTYTNVMVSSENVKTASSAITSIPLTVSLAGSVHTLSSNRKTLNSPNF